MHRVGAGLVAGVVGIALAACGSGSTSAPAGGGGSAAGGGTPLKLGFLGSLSGPAGAIGANQRAGVEMAVQELNAAGGVDGRRVALSAQDDKSDPTSAVQGMRQLLDSEQVSMVFGPTLSSPTSAVAPLATQAKVIEIGTAVVPAVGDASKFPYFFRTSPVATLQAQTFVSYMNGAGLRRAALLAVNNELGTGNVAAFKAAIAGTAITVTDTEFHDSGTVDLTPQLQKLKAGGADALLVLNTAPPDQIAAIKGRNAVQWAVPALGFSTMADPAVAQAVGQGGVANVFAGQVAKKLTTTGPSTTKAWLGRLRTYLKKTTLDKDISQTAVGYDSVMMYADAVRGAGSTDPAKVAAYRESHVYEGVANDYSYDAKRHDGVTLADLTFVKAGSFADGLYQGAQ